MGAQDAYLFGIRSGVAVLGLGSRGGRGRGFAVAGHDYLRASMHWGQPQNAVQVCSGTGVK
ncbi:hypothetical protein GCM10008960_36380 [Deinococcus sedimenti]|uniref:Uncharacterized protein n=1 Tax=Deinococcus sedimenti TaxID=1867090 RepID=A0ABQ2SBD1_9DEIO|nr:hypothetical protein GCM10008960_36380 [Deinococcus sedimenti]